MNRIPASPQLFIRTISRFDSQQGRDVEVSREVSPESFKKSAENIPQDAVVQTSSYTATPTDKERYYPTSDRVDENGKTPETREQEGILFLHNRQTVQYAGNSPAVIFQEELKTGPDDFSVKVLDGSAERERYVDSADTEAKELIAIIKKEVAQKTPESVRAWDKTLMESRGKFLNSRYGERENLSVFEIGPGTTGAVPRVFLAKNNNNEYTGMDISQDALKMQREILTEDGLDKTRMNQVVGDYRAGLPVKDASQDVILGFASIGTWDSTDKVKSYFDEFDRVLKPGGEILVGGVGLEQASPVAIAHILSKFELVPQRETDQSVDMILKKRETGPSQSNGVPR